MNQDEKVELEQLKRENDQLRSCIADARYRIEQGRVWSGMGWTLTGLSSNGQQKALDAIDAAPPKATLSLQAEPVEPAPAQDEREVAAVIGFYEGEREPRLLSWNVLPNGEHRLYTRPAQTEQQPVGQWSDDEGLSWCDGSPHELASARESGWLTRTLYATPSPAMDAKEE